MSVTLRGVIQQTYDPAIPLADIAEHPENPRRGRDEAVDESIEHNDFFGAILIQKSSKLIIAGNTRYRTMRSRGEDTIPGFWVDCDDDTAKRILLADNRVSDLAWYDERQMLELLQALQAQTGSLAGTGYDEQIMAELQQQLDELDADPLPPDGFPIIDPDDLDIQYRCPSCQYEWSGSPRPGEPVHEPTDAD